MTTQAETTWWKVKLGEVCELVSSGTTPSRTEGSSFLGAVNWVKSKELTDGKIYETEEKITEEAVKDRSLKKYPPETVVMAIYASPTVGRLGLLMSEATVNQACVALVADKNKILPRYLFYSLLFSRLYLQNLAVGVAQQNLNVGVVRNFEIDLPSVSDQKRIADVLSAFDDKIELNNKISLTLEQMAQAIFKEWFVNFRFPGHEKVKMIDSELGKIPERWGVKKLPEVFDFLEGPGIRNWQYTSKGCPFINIRLIQSNDIDIRSASFISEKEANGKYKHFHLKERDMVVSTSGTLGRSAIVRKEHLPLLLNTSVIRFRPKDNKSYAFMYQFLNFTYFQNKVLSMASGSAQPNFGPVHLRQIAVLIPGRNVLDMFGETVNPMYERIIANMSENQKLATLRDLLLSKLMSGEIRV